MQWIAKLGNLLQSPFLLIIRLYWGYQFLITGIGKFLNYETVSAFFQTLNLPPWMAYVIGSLEALGGLLLLLGLFSRYAGLVLFGVMIGAYATAYPEVFSQLFSNPQPFFMKDPFLFGLAALLVFLFGPGFFSLDRLLSRDKD